MLYLRVLSALVGIPIVLGAVYMGGVWYAGLVTVVAIIGSYEYNNIFIKRNHKIPHLITYPAVIMILAAIYFAQINLLYPILTLVMLVLFSSVLFRVKTTSITDAAIVLWGIVYLGIFLSYMILLRVHPQGLLYTYILLIGVWVHDTLAYFVGSKWGLNKLAPEISPNKSVEGSIAGILGTVILFLSFSILYPDLMPIGPFLSILLGLGLSVFSQLGDLMESSMKRQLKVKDSGSLIPGHGGILDRFDSLMLATPFVYYFILLFG